MKELEARAEFAVAILLLILDVFQRSIVMFLAVGLAIKTATR